MQGGKKGKKTRLCNLHSPKRKKKKGKLRCEPAPGAYAANGGLHLRLVQVIPQTAAAASADKTAHRSYAHIQLAGESQVELVQCLRVSRTLVREFVLYKPLLPRLQTAVLNNRCATHKKILLPNDKRDRKVPLLCPDNASGDAESPESIFLIFTSFVTADGKNITNLED